MSYHNDTIDWQSIEIVDRWLDGMVSDSYKDQPLAQDWARISKVSEELGEAIRAFIGTTGQNPRKGVTHSQQEVLDELADTAITAIFAIQHFTKSSYESRFLLMSKLRTILDRVPKSEWYS